MQRRREARRLLTDNAILRKSRHIIIIIIILILIIIIIMVLADHPYVQGRSSDGIGRMHMKGASGAFQVFLENTGKKTG